MAVSSISFTNCLFFETEAEEAANFYVSIFPNSSIETVALFPEIGQEIHKQKAGSVMAVPFTLAGAKFFALNSKPATPEMAFNESVSFMITVEGGQDQVDYYWDKLTEGADANRQICGWLKDKFGVHWQVVPKVVADNMCSGNVEKMTKTQQAVMRMKKPVIQDVIDALEGKDEHAEQV